MIAFIKGLLCDSKGIPDEASVSYIAVQIFVFLGFAYNAIHDRHFDGVAFLTCEGGLVTLYNLTRKS